MTDLDRTNVYSYRGKNYTGDLHDYLTARGLDIRTVEYQDEHISIEDELKEYHIPMYAQWGSIVKFIRREE
jgi:hypothetical protein